MRVIECEARTGKCRKCNISEKDLEDILRVLWSGGLIVYATDTIYALGGDPFNEDALERIFRAKKRPRTMPSAIMFPNIEEAAKIVGLDEKVREIVAEHLPGPFTFILKKRESAALSELLMKDGAVGIRVPAHPLALRLAREFGPLTVTSANLHDGQDPAEIETAIRELGDAVDIYIDCGPCAFGVPSTVLDATSERMVILRKGAGGGRS